MHYSANNPNVQSDAMNKTPYTQPAISERKRMADEKEWALRFIDTRGWEVFEGEEFKQVMRNLSRIMTEHEIETDSQFLL